MSLFGFAPQSVSEYNQDQLASVKSILGVLFRLSAEETDALRTAIRPYLEFRQNVGEYFGAFFKSSCQTRCFDTHLSVCCGFESIITFFADHVVSLMMSNREEIEALISVLTRPNLTERCVYLGASGCLWKVPPISCSMFLCPQVKETIFDSQPEAEARWIDLRQGEKQFTWPDKPVLFDELEVLFMRRGCDTPHLFFHRSPGLLRIKSKAGLGMRA